MLTCCRLSEQEGPVQEVTGNTPLLLEGSEHVWLVLSERIDVFAVPVENGQPCGARSQDLTLMATVNGGEGQNDQWKWSQRCAVT